MRCQMATSKGWDLFHIHLKTAFLQGQSYDVNREVVCQLPPEASNNTADVPSFTLRTASSALPFVSALVRFGLLTGSQARFF